MEEKHKSVVLFVLVLLFAYWSYLILSPFLQFIIFGLVLAFLFFPLFASLRKRAGDNLAASITLCIVFLLIIIPCIWLAATLISQAAGAFQAIQASGYTFDGGQLITSIESTIGIDLHSAVVDLLKTGSAAVATSLPGIITGTGAFFLGLFLLFLAMFYALKDGASWFDAASAVLPLSNAQRRRLNAEVENVTRALFFGQVVTAAIEGVVFGIIFWMFGISNPVFWGFVMMILAFLPIVGAPIIYIPAGIILAVNGAWFNGIAIIILCTVLLLVFDNYVRPLFVTKNASIHPLTVILGAVGGVAMMGLLGFLLGPLILNVFLTLVKFSNE